MKILLVYPQYPDTFWSLKYALNIFGKKAGFPPIGLLTVASMLPLGWEKKLVDMNVEPLSDGDIKWADYVFIGAMVVQRKSAVEVIERCRELNVKTVAGGPLFTSEPDKFGDVDYLVLGDAEITLPLFMNDLGQRHPEHIYDSTEWANLSTTPAPMWSLINMKHYFTMSVQYSRGCPFDCEFCDIVLLNGHTPRTKNREQIIIELDALYNKGWRSLVFIVDDNFIGNKKKLKNEILPTIATWQQRRNYPFLLYTQASINLADDEELMELMTKAGFDSVFIGIETMNKDSLSECGKHQNENRNLLDSVNRIMSHGLQVHGGFIVGFDNDPMTIFDTQINFIQDSGIVMAMVGLLNAPVNTRLYQRLKREGRLLNDFSGDMTDCSINFIPKMDSWVLIDGYRHVLASIYSPVPYYNRADTFLRKYRPRRIMVAPHFEWWHLGVLFRSVWVLGITDGERRHFWKSLLWVLLSKPRSFPMWMIIAVYGFHFRKILSKLLSAPQSSPDRFETGYTHNLTP